MSDHRSPDALPARPAHARHVPLGLRPRRALAVGALLAAVALAACSSGGSPATSPAGSDGLTGAPSPSLGVPTIGVPTALPGEGEVPQAVIDLAVADAADRAGVDPSDVTLVSAETHTWPSGALGCPEPGFLYTDVLTPGYRVVVEAGGREYDYRATQRGGTDVRWCERPAPGG